MVDLASLGLPAAFIQRATGTSALLETKRVATEPLQAISNVGLTSGEGANGDGDEVRAVSASNTLNLSGDILNIFSQSGLGAASGVSAGQGGVYQILANLYAQTSQLAGNIEKPEVFSSPISIEG